MERPSRLGDVAALLPARVERHYGTHPRVDALRSVCDRFTAGARPVDPDGLDELQDGAQTVFRHLELTHAAGLPVEHESTGWPPADLPAITRAGAGIAAVLTDVTGAAVIRLTELAPVAAAAPLLAGAFALVRRAERVVIDLRANAGGDPATVVLIADWLAGGPPRHLFDVRYRDRTRQWWTAGAPSVPPPDGLVRVLIGPGTYSSGEALAWALQRQRLATVAGQPSRGAADHVVPLNLTHDVRAHPGGHRRRPRRRADLGGRGRAARRAADRAGRRARHRRRHDRSS